MAVRASCAQINPSNDRFFSESGRLYMPAQSTKALAMFQREVPITSGSKANGAITTAKTGP